MTFPVCRLNRFSIAAVILASSTTAANSQDLYGCGRPIGEPPIPDGSVATITEMQTARDSVEIYLDKGDAFVDCLSTYPDDPVAAAIRDQVLLQMDLVVVRFNDALCVYSAGAECVDTSAAIQPQAPGVIVESDNGADALAESYLGIEPPTTALGVETASVPSDAPQASGLVPNDQRSLSRVEEPSLPDGTPCGSVTKTREHQTGEASSLRGHYAWEIYNSCIDPIRVRWTFRGDGVLNSERTIEGRGFQNIGCSSAAGRVSSRYCTGGVEYFFEWP